MKPIQKNNKSHDFTHSCATPYQSGFAISQTFVSQTHAHALSEEIILAILYILRKSNVLIKLAILSNLHPKCLFQLYIRTDQHQTVYACRLRETDLLSYYRFHIAEYSFFAICAGGGWLQSVL